MHNTSPARTLLPPAPSVHTHANGTPASLLMATCFGRVSCTTMHLAAGERCGTTVLIAFPPAIAACHGLTILDAQSNWLVRVIAHVP